VYVPVPDALSSSPRNATQCLQMALSGLNPDLSPRFKPRVSSHHLVWLRGAIMRPREAGRGAAPAGSATQAKHSGGTGAPPGTTMSPCQELADRLGKPGIRKARPDADKTPRYGAPERRPPLLRKEERTPQVCAFRRAIPSSSMRGSTQSPDVFRIAATIALGLFDIAISLAASHAVHAGSCG